MNKASEIAILKEAIAKLGNDSYIGPALAELVPFVESEIRSDIFPDLLGSIKILRKEKAELEAKVKELSEKERNIIHNIASKESSISHLDANISKLKEQLKGLCQRVMFLCD